MIRSLSFGHARRFFVATLVLSAGGSLAQGQTIQPQPILVTGQILPIAQKSSGVTGEDGSLADNEAKNKAAGDPNIKPAALQPGQDPKALPIPTAKTDDDFNKNKSELQKFRDELNNIFKDQAEMIRSIGLSGIRRGAGEGEGVVINQGRVGFQLNIPSEELRSQAKLPEGEGLLIKEVFPKTPAEEVGYKKNDVLLEFNGKKVPSNHSEFWHKIMRHVKNDTGIPGVVLREGQRVNIGPLKVTDRRVIPVLPNEVYLEPSQLIQVAPGLNSNQSSTVTVPEYRIIRGANGVTEIIPFYPNKK